MKSTIQVQVKDICEEKFFVKKYYKQISRYTSQGRLFLVSYAQKVNKIINSKCLFICCKMNNDDAFIGYTKVLKNKKHPLVDSRTEIKNKIKIKDIITYSIIDQTRLSIKSLKTIENQVENIVFEFPSKVIIEGWLNYIIEITSKNQQQNITTSQIKKNQYYKAEVEKYTESIKKLEEQFPSIQLRQQNPSQNRLNYFQKKIGPQEIVSNKYEVQLLTNNNINKTALKEKEEDQISINQFNELEAFIENGNNIENYQIIQQMNSVIENQAKTIQDLQKQLKKQTLANQNLRDQNQKLKLEYSAFRKEVQRKLQQLNQQKVELQSANSKIIQLKNYKEIPENKTSIHQKTIVQLQTKIRVSENHRILKQSQLETHIAKLQAQIEELEEQKTQLTKKLKRNEQVRLQLQESNNMLREQYAQLYANFEIRADERIGRLDQEEERLSFSDLFSRQRHTSLIDHLSSEGSFQ